MHRYQICKTDVRKMDGKKKVNPAAARMAWAAWIGRGLVTVLLVVFLNAAATAAHFGMLQQGIAEEVLRFHVLANSDSEEDQAVKYLVRDAVLSWISEAMDENSSERYSPVHEISILTETGENEMAREENETQNESQNGMSIAMDSRGDMLQFLTDNLSEIEGTANSVLEKQDVSYRAIAEITWSYFPDRTYGDCTFPAGWYQALRICLGAAKGRNWWCLLYPSLCFTDALHAVVDETSREKLEEVLTVEEYQSLLASPGKWKIAFRWF